MLTQFLAKVSRVDSHDYHVGWGDGAGDQLNSVHTVYMLLAFSGFSLSGFFFVEPIECWCPAFFTKSHVKFTNKVGSGGKKETCSKLRQEICSNLHVESLCTFRWKVLWGFGSFEHLHLGDSEYYIQSSCTGVWHKCSLYRGALAVVKH